MSLFTANDLLRAQNALQHSSDFLETVYEGALIPLPTSDDFVAPVLLLPLVGLLGTEDGLIAVEFFPLQGEDSGFLLQFGATLSLDIAPEDLPNIQHLILEKNKVPALGYLTLSPNLPRVCLRHTLLQMQETPDPVQFLSTVLILKEQSEIFAPLLRQYIAGEISLETVLDSSLF